MAYNGVADNGPKTVTNGQSTLLLPNAFYESSLHSAPKQNNPNVSRMEIVWWIRGGYPQHRSPINNDLPQTRLSQHQCITTPRMCLGHVLRFPHGNNTNTKSKHMIEVAIRGHTICFESFDYCQTLKHMVGCGCV